MTDTILELGLDDTGRRIVERLGGRWTAAGGLCRCPAHDDRRPSLSVRPGRTQLLLRCFAGCRTQDVLRALRLEGLEVAGQRGDCTLAVGDRDAERGRSAARALWGRARPLAGTLAGTYLAGRSVETVDPSLRFYHRTPDGPRPLTRFRPALIAAVCDGSGLVAVHRTFLGRSGGTGPRVLHRAALGRLGGGAVRLGGVAARLGLAEGIESALAASILFGLPCWATLGTERLARVSIPDEVEQLVLFLDNDAAGRAAEARMRAAWPERSIETCFPELDGADWADMLRRKEGRERG